MLVLRRPYHTALKERPPNAPACPPTRPAHTRATDACVHRLQRGGTPAFNQGTPLRSTGVQGVFRTLRRNLVQPTAWPQMEKDSTDPKHADAGHFASHCTGLPTMTCTTNSHCMCTSPARAEVVPSARPTCNTPGRFTWAACSSPTANCHACNQARLAPDHCPQLQLHASTPVPRYVTMPPAVRATWQACGRQPPLLLCTAPALHRPLTGSHRTAPPGPPCCSGL